MEANVMGEQKDFVVATRYRIRPVVNAVLDTASGTEVRVEPRLMKLLCILSEHSGQLVTREQLVKEIWDDYGGGEEGLTQAISSLRKLLNDASKTLIETVPKKGYILQTEITCPPTTNKMQAGSKEKPRGKPAFFLPLLFLTLAAFTGLIYFFMNEGMASSLPSKPTGLRIAFDEVSRQPEETWLNTIVTVGADSTHYKLIVRGDSRPDFYINGRLVAPDEMENHLLLINNLTQELRKRNTQ